MFHCTNLLYCLVVGVVYIVVQTVYDSLSRVSCLYMCSLASLSSALKDIYSCHGDSPFPLPLSFSIAFDLEVKLLRV